MSSGWVGGKENRRKNDFSEFIVQLIRRFEESPERYLQINTISYETGVEKRRLYDLMNVLTACGICVKANMHTYRWKGVAAFQETLKVLGREAELRSKERSIRHLFELADSPTIGMMTTSFMSMFMYIGISTLNIRDVAILMAADEERTKPIIRRLYLVTYLLEHIGILKHTKKIGEYEICSDLDKLELELLTEMRQNREFPPDRIEYQLTRIDISFLPRLREQRRGEFTAYVTSSLAVQDDPRDAPYETAFRGIDI